MLRHCWKLFDLISLPDKPLREVLALGSRDSFGEVYAIFPVSFECASEEVIWLMRLTGTSGRIFILLAVEQQHFGSTAPTYAQFRVLSLASLVRTGLVLELRILNK